MNEAVARLAQRLKNRLSVRRKKAARGRFNVKKTLRKNLQYGGVPFHIQLDRRKKTKPQVMVLCDISDSVLNASRFMLQFVYSVQDLYSKVRSFVFVAEIGEVTKLFEEHDIQTAVEAALEGRCHRCFLSFQLRPRLRAILSKLFFRGQRQDHRADHRRRAQQLQPSKRLGAAGDPAKGQATHLAQSGEPHDLGHRRQRNAALRAPLSCRRRMPQHQPALQDRRFDRAVNKKIYIQTYGCQMNQYDSERIAQVMARRGYVPDRTHRQRPI